jgi:hypothetical protein
MYFSSQLDPPAHLIEQLEGHSLARIFWRRMGSVLSWYNNRMKNQLHISQGFI